MLTLKNYRKVPVLIITQGKIEDGTGDVFDEMSALLKKIGENILDDFVAGLPTGQDEPIVQTSNLRLSDFVQLLRERDDHGNLLKDEWNEVIKQATRRGGTHEARKYMVTITDIFGGRGHDFNVMDEDANKAGGMLVI